MSPSVAQAVVVFLLTDELAMLPDEHLPELIEAADLFMVEALRACAVQEAARRVSLLNLAAMWRLGELLGLQRLSDAASSFAALHLDDVVKLADFGDLVMGSARDIQAREDEDSVPVLDDAAASIRMQFGSEQEPYVVADLVERSPVSAIMATAAEASPGTFPFERSLFHKDGGELGDS